ncbi:DUF2797 domain-containing protein [Streptomyces sp. NPDC059176]|uniref:DUF2797 domain-containing protein n=1 Tax=unclassified Streptomyces TaxID=2593676 RepID=UPI003696B281
MSSGRWQCRGMGWVPGGGAVLRWERAGERRRSPLVLGQRIGFRAVGARSCLGARGNACPVAAVVPGRSTGGLCPECARLERVHSVAADTVADDPRPYRVYLAWFGPGLVKVGITAEERGAARLLEQGAVVFGWLGRGPLMAARRTEELLRAALGVPDRIPYGQKRVVRAMLTGTAADRAVEVTELYARAVALAQWPEALERVELDVVDHVGVFGLEGLPAASGVVRALEDGGTVAGRVIAAAGPDLHLIAPGGRVVVVDTRVMAGWQLVAAADGAAVTVPVDELPRGVQDGLF